MITAPSLPYDANDATCTNQRGRKLCCARNAPSREESLLAFSRARWFSSPRRIDEPFIKIDKAVIRPQTETAALELLIPRSVKPMPCTLLKKISPSLSAACQEEA
jgi:hypothetical protein